MNSRPRPHQPAAMLALAAAALFWSGNFIAGRALRGAVDPVTLNVLRWLICLGLFLPWVRGGLRREWPVVRREWRLVAALGATGIAGFHTMVYLALTQTTAVNALLILSLAPTVTLLGAAFVWNERLSPPQWLGSGVSLLGALVLVTRGDVSGLMLAGVGVGDLWMLGAVVAWAAYTLLLRERPADLSQEVTLAGSIAAGLAFMAPLVLLQGGFEVFRPSTLSLGALLYIAVFASLIAFLLWSYGVHEIGSARAGQFIYLMPVFGSVLAVLLLGERIGASQAIGSVLIFTGIVLTQRTPGRA